MAVEKNAKVIMREDYGDDVEKAKRDYKRFIQEGPSFSSIRAAYIEQALGLGSKADFIEAR